MDRRHFLIYSGSALAVGLARQTYAADAAPAFIGKVVKTPEEWRLLLTPAQFNVLREEGTEHPFTSPLNNEKRKGPMSALGARLRCSSRAPSTTAAPAGRASGTASRVASRRRSTRGRSMATRNTTARAAAAIMATSSTTVRSRRGFVIATTASRSSSFRRDATDARPRGGRRRAPHERLVPR